MILRRVSRRVGRRRAASSSGGRSGRRGESAAARHLRGLGYRVVGRNVQTRAGEIDLLARTPDGGTLVVVEVKTRMAGAAGLAPERRVGSSKQRKLLQLARSLLRQPRYRAAGVRVDVVGVDLPVPGWRAWVGLDRPTVRHYPDAVRA
ncbi:MAG: YraN family protein [Planctomycetota bacterium]